MLQILHPLFARNLMPVSKAGYERIVEHDELRAPSGQLYGLHVLFEVWGSEALSHYSFPWGHILPPFQSTQSAGDTCSGQRHVIEDLRRFASFRGSPAFQCE